MFLCYGCEGNILQLLKLPDGTVKVLVEGIKRVKILDFKDNEKFIICDYAHLSRCYSLKMKIYSTLALTAVRRLEKLTSINKKVSNETINNIKKLTDASHKLQIILLLTLKQQLFLKNNKLFETIDVKKRLKFHN